MIRAFIEFVTSQCGWHLVRRTPTRESTSFIKIYWQLVKNTANDDARLCSGLIQSFRCASSPAASTANVSALSSPSPSNRIFCNGYQIQVNATNNVWTRALTPSPPHRVRLRMLWKNPITIKNYSYCKSNIKLSVLSKYPIRANALGPSASSTE